MSFPGRRTARSDHHTQKSKETKMKEFIVGAAAAVILVLGAPAYAQDTQAPGYMIANYTITDQAVFQKYMEEAGPLAPKYGGKIIVFNMNASAVEGEPKSVMANCRVSKRC
jgi:Domain of unknown function (DUF1330)